MSGLNGFAHRQVLRIDPWEAWAELAAKAIAVAADPGDTAVFVLAGARKLAGRVAFPVEGYSAQLPAKQLLELAGMFGSGIMPERVPVLTRLLAAQADAVRTLLEMGREALEADAAARVEAARHSSGD